jgi:hypothetical protein
MNISVIDTSTTSINNANDILEDQIKNKPNIAMLM